MWPRPERQFDTDLIKELRRVLGFNAEPQRITNPAGLMARFSSPRTPDGWLACDGRSLDARAYPELAKVLGSVDGKVTLPAEAGWIIKA